MTLFLKTIFLHTVLYLFQGYTVSASNDSQSLEFFAIGDWGGIPLWPYRTPELMAISTRMETIAEQRKTDFVLSLGDNFYFNGVSSVDDSRFKETFENSFNHSALQIPWLISVGNHDYNGNISAQLAYSKRSKRWYFPNNYFKTSFTIPNSNTDVDIVIIDTIILCGITSSDYSAKQPQQRAKYNRITEEHWTWIEKTLKESKAHYLLAAGHYPVYSIGFHGSTKCLVKRLEPLLQKYKVSAYFSGHDHNLQHIQPKGQTWQVEYFVSGCTNFIDPTSKNKKTIPPDSLKFHWGTLFSLGALSYVHVTPSKLTVSFMDAFGKELYDYSFPPRIL